MIVVDGVVLDLWINVLGGQERGLKLEHRSGFTQWCYAGLYCRMPSITGS
jgi:hypothetical protein